MNEQKNIKNMDLATTIIGLMILLIFILPFVVLAMKSKKKNDSSESDSLSI